jgi:hypothetical protein
MKGYALTTNLARAVRFGAAVVLLFCAVQRAMSTPAPQASKPQIATKALPDAQVGKDYVKVIEASGGKLPWNFSAKGQAPGLSFDTIRGPNTTDMLHGVPTEAGDFSVEITVTDSSDPPQSSTTRLKLHVNPK